MHPLGSSVQPRIGSRQLTPLQIAQSLRDEFCSSGETAKPGHCIPVASLLSKAFYFKGYDFQCKEIRGTCFGIDHVWNEFDGMILDITADQFPQITETIVFASYSDRPEYVKVSERVRDIDRLRK